jgi:hypothetical protein
VPLGLAVTVLGMAARGAVVLRVVERRTLERPPNWPLCVGWLRARTAPHAECAGEIVEVAAAPGDREVRRLERAIVAGLPAVEAVDAPSPGFREAAAVVHAGEPVPLGALLVKCFASGGGGKAVRALAADDEATTWIAGGSDAQEAVRACREAAPAWVDRIEREAAAATAPDDDEPGADAGP